MSTGSPWIRKAWLHHELGHLLGRGSLGEMNEVGGFGKPIHYVQDGGVAIRLGETREKFQGDVRPGMVRNMQRLKETSRSLPVSLVL
jgi:hypothetical protein